ncbi:MAG TPA: AzlC family ABC transporter permease [Acidimicrobiales bacterium]|nr:AzlC family ABC transporter permease [Acidimicrobiales bacterium]
MGALLPIATAVSVFGVSFGVLARAEGLPAWQAALMSATVFAGSAQFAAVSVLADGGSALAAVVSGALLNSRYIATGVAVAGSLPGNRLRRVLLGQLVVDESFALGAAAGEPGRPHAPTLLRAGAVLWVAWVGGTVLGTALGDVVGDPARLGLDAAFPALFLALLWPMVRDDRRHVRPALLGALVGLVLSR